MLRVYEFQVQVIQLLKKTLGRLDGRYGSSELIELALKQKLVNFPRYNSVRQKEALCTLLFTCSEIASIKESPAYVDAYVLLPPDATEAIDLLNSEG